MLAKPHILISSCLIGLPVKYNGKSKLIQQLLQLVKKGKAIFVCPEQLGGLPTPRAASEIPVGKTAGDVLAGKVRIIGKDGSDQTAAIIAGARQTLKLCLDLGITMAILRESSPSCGSHDTFDGTFTGGKVPGRGVLGELLQQNGIEVYSEEHLPPELS